MRIFWTDDYLINHSIPTPLKSKIGFKAGKQRPLMSGPDDVLKLEKLKACLRRKFKIEEEQEWLKVWVDIRNFVNQIGRSKKCVRSRKQLNATNADLIEN